MSENDRSQLEQVREYRRLVAKYEALDEKIDSLIMANDGGAEKMSAADLQQYRDWAQQRAEALNEMRILERQLNIGADGDAE